MGRTWIASLGGLNLGINHMFCDINDIIFYEQVNGLELNRHKRASCFSEPEDLDILFDGNVKTPGSERAVRGSGNREVVFAKTKSREVV